MESNITLKSNVYINRTASRNDRDFLRHITDYRVLRLRDKRTSGVLDAEWMTKAQREIVRLGSPQCTYEKGTMSWGVPVGAQELRCRCEQKDCRLYSRCSALANFDLIEREKEVVSKQKETKADVLPLYRDAEVPREEEAAPTQIALSPSVPQEAVLPHADDGAPERIDQKQLIRMREEERICLSAGPGCGKTYVAAEKLRYLLEHENSRKGEKTLVLCLSIRAVQVMRAHLLKVCPEEGQRALTDGRIQLKTFETFASQIVGEGEKLTADPEKLLEEAVAAMEDRGIEISRRIGYLIVDELQDIVGVRARLLMALVRRITCGALLMGDPCQAMYEGAMRRIGDMSCQTLMQELSDCGFRNMEMRGNHRQTGDLSEYLEDIRFALLSGDETAEQRKLNDFRNWVSDSWQRINIQSLSQTLGDGDLVLCMNNGEAAMVTQELYDMNPVLLHSMTQPPRHASLAAWIAKCLQGNDGKLLSYEDFMTNAGNFGVEHAGDRWAILSSLDGHGDGDWLHIPELLDALRRPESLPGDCLNLDKKGTLVSTVQRARGTQAERVFWLDGSMMYSNMEASQTFGDTMRAAYVASSRARREIRFVDGMWPSLRMVAGDRWISVGKSKGKRSEFVKSVAMQPGDVDPASFAGNTVGLDAQAALSQMEKGMTVDLYPDAGMNAFEIYFDGLPLGYTSQAFTKSLFVGFAEVNGNESWPSRIPDVYVTDIISVVGATGEDLDADIAASGCWLALELGGFPTLEWY